MKKTKIEKLNFKVEMAFLPLRICECGKEEMNLPLVVEQKCNLLHCCIWDEIPELKDKE